MTWEELKRHIRSLGFEDDAQMEEYTEIVLDAVNRSLRYVLFHDVVPNEGYFANKYTTWTETTDPYTGEVIRHIENQWVPAMPEDLFIDETTDDDFEIDIPPECIDLVSLLAAHYVWLDDDQAKAILYWNEYDDAHNGLIESISKVLKCTTYGGLLF